MSFFNMKQKIIIALLLFVVSCSLTEKMWNPYYKEKIGRFMLAQNGEFVAFLGKDYHYILNDNSGIIKSLLFSRYRHLMYIMSNETFIKLSQNNDLVAYIAIKLTRGNVDSAIERDLAHLGFGLGDDGVLALKIKLEGKRYLAGKNFPVEVASSLNDKYSIKIYEEVSAAKKIEKVMLTPITATIDATLLIGKILLVPFAGN